MDEVLASTLRVLNRLGYMDDLVADAAVQSRAALADTELTRMTSAWRALLAQHGSDENGRCRQCWSGCRRRHIHHPCSVWISVHEYLMNPGAPTTGRRSRHAAAPGRHKRGAAGRKRVVNAVLGP